MRPYEIMIILEAGLEEESIRPVLDRVSKLVTDGGGSVGKVDRWGRRRFAYEVNHRAEGYYVVVETMTEPGVVSDIDRVLGLADEVIRHKVIRLPEKVAGRARSGSSAPAPAAASSTDGA
jgi:small subunit ribosomal protein S6